MSDLSYKLIESKLKKIDYEIEELENQLNKDEKNFSFL